jgi:hypothetical protein
VSSYEIITERTYVCKCENTNKSAIESRKETEWENDIVAYDYPFKTDYLTGGATCQYPCVTREQIDAATSAYTSWDYNVAGWITAVAAAKLASKIAAASLNPYLIAFAVTALSYAEQSLDNAKSSFDAAHEKLNELRKLPYCYPKPQRPGGCD